MAQSRTIARPVPAASDDADRTVIVRDALNRVPVSADDPRGLSAAIKATLSLFPEPADVVLTVTAAGRAMLIDYTERNFRIEFSALDRERFSTYFGITIETVGALPELAAPQSLPENSDRCGLPLGPAHACLPRRPLLLDTKVAEWRQSAVEIIPPPLPMGVPVHPVISNVAGLDGRPGSVTLLPAPKHPFLSWLPRLIARMFRR